MDLLTLKKAGCVATLSLCSISAFAALGEPASTIVQDKQAVHASVMKQVNVAATSGTNYTVQQLSDDASQNVYEYINTQGIVFAVSWSGPVKPDLSTLLGNYFSQMADNKSQSRAHKEVVNNDVVISSSGRMRSFKGYAYVPSLTPAGFTFPALNAAQ
jgi:hypothetical protein